MPVWSPGSQFSFSPEKSSENRDSDHFFNYKLQITDYKLQITNYKLQIEEGK